MPLRRTVRESAFRLVRHDLAHFLKDHEDRLMAIFREEMQVLDDSIPEENLFIDIHMVALGEAILQSALHAIERFLVEDYEISPTAQKTTIPVQDQGDKSGLKLRDSRE